MKWNWKNPRIVGFPLRLASIMEYTVEGVMPERFANALLSFSISTKRAMTASFTVICIISHGDMIEIFTRKRILSPDEYRERQVLIFWNKAGIIKERGGPMLQFEWDEHKNRINREKHGISFEEARTVFYDDNAIVIPDPDHSTAEERFIILGFSEQARMLVVCHCLRNANQTIRIISARKATKKEAIQYV